MDGSFYFSIDWEADFDSKEAFFTDFTDNLRNFLTFRKWMKDHLGIEPIKNWKTKSSKEANVLIEKAKQKHQKSFDKWQYQFYPDPKVEEAIYKNKEEQEEKEEFARLEKELKENPTIDTYLGLTKHLNRFSQKERYKKYLFQALALDEKNEKVWNKIKRFYFSLRLATKKENYKEEVCQYIKPENFDEAFDFYKEVEEKYPAFAPLFYGDLAHSYEKKEEFETAIEYYKKSVLYKPDSYGDYDQVSIIKACKKIKKDPITVLEEIVEKVDSKETSKTLYKLCVKKKQNKKALQHFQKYDEMNKGLQAFEYLEFCSQLYKNDAYDELFEVANKGKSVGYDDQNADCYNYLALVCEDRGEIEQALKYSETAHELDPEEETYKDNIEIFQQKMKENKKGFLGRFFRK